MQLPDNFNATWQEINGRLKPTENQHCNKVGLLGEFAFGEFCGVYPNLNKSEADSGIDFNLPLLFTVDVKTSVKWPPYLLVKTNVSVPDIVVLVYYNEGNPKLMGWEFGSVIINKPVKDFGCGTPSYYINSNELKPMEKLKKRLFLRGLSNG